MLNYFSVENSSNIYFGGYLFPISCPSFACFLLSYFILFFLIIPYYVSSPYLTSNYKIFLVVGLLIVYVLSVNVFTSENIPCRYTSGKFMPVKNPTQIIIQIRIIPKMKSNSL